MNDLIFEHVSLSFGAREVLRDFSLTVPAGGRCVLMGASGSGKTSILRLASGLIKPTSGRVLGTPPDNLFSMQFQEPRLLPWLTAEENVNLVLSDNKSTLPQARAWLSRVGLADACGLYPAQLSGGMQQRVALCRALAAPHDVLLLDEPFRGLDSGTRAQTMALVADFVSGSLTGCDPKTLLLVTHDAEEASFFTDTPVVIA